MILFPNVKINLGLFVTGKRSDGYHSIESLFIPVPWKEALEVVPMSGDSGEEFRLICHGAEIDGDLEDNIITKVFRKLKTIRSVPPLEVHLLKRLPMGAGLGGGSADAAFALRAMNNFLDDPLSDSEAESVLASVGSDCPFFWRNRPMFVSGRGEVMEETDFNLGGYHVVLVNPGIHISTKEAYAGVHIDPAPGIDLRTLSSLPIEQWKEHVYNAFEPGIFESHAEIEALKTEMYDQGAEYASMTGSGSTVYGIFREEPDIPEKWKSQQHWVGKL